MLALRKKIVLYSRKILIKILTMKSICYAILGAAFLTSCTSVTRTYNIMPKSGTDTQGTAIFTQKGKTVKLDLNAYKLTPNTQLAAHIHEFGDCSSADGKSAGGHWNPTSQNHGKWGSAEHHAGDLGNMKTTKEGSGRILMSTDKWCLGCADPNKNLYGKSIIIHEKADDFHTQPTGNAGGRIGCVEIK